MRGNPTFIWNRADDARLKELVRAGVPAREIATVIGCKPHHVYRRSKALYLERRDARFRGRPMGEVLEVPPIWTNEELSEMGIAFAKAMIAAVKSGAERAPFGVVKSPCTARAVFVPSASFVPSQSVAADAVDFGR